MIKNVLSDNLQILQVMEEPTKDVEGLPNKKKILVHWTEF